MNKNEYLSVVKELTARLFRFVKKSIPNEDSCNDIVQEAFVRLWEKHPNVPVEKAKAWLFMVGYRLMLDELKRTKRFIDNETDVQSEKDSTIHQMELQEVIQLGLQILPTIQKQVLLLRDLEGYAYDEIGEILQLTESQVKVYLFRARTKMKDFLKEKK